VRLVCQEVILLLCVCCSDKRQCIVQHEIYEAEKYLCIYNYKLSEIQKRMLMTTYGRKWPKKIEDTGMYYFYLFITVPTCNHIINIEVHVIILE
jgi:hypothetical protein